MSYISLYRKWRPRTFDDVKGQDAVVTTLKNQIKTGRAGHAYIFIGTRGTGKTSVAKIMAAALNCENLQDGNPCCECESCRSIISGEAMNVREIDAASNTGVENVREIREDVLYPPATGKRKVYIIDEVHMLSTGAFNALLKTLEEPPEYVTFILATTETSKIPLTIFSRCQRYDFHRISISEIENRIKMLAKEEGFEIEDKACNYLARKADGAMRDALSLLDRCAAFTMGEKISYESVLNAIGAVDTEIFSTLFKFLVAADTLSCLKVLDEVVSGGGVLSTFITDFIGYLRNLLLLSASSDQDISDILESTEETVERMKKETELTDPETLTMYIRALSALLVELKATNNQKTAAEVAFIKLTRPPMDNEEVNAAAMKRIQALEKSLSEALAKLEAVSANPQAVYPQANASMQAAKDKASEAADRVGENVIKMPGKAAEVSTFTKNHTPYESLNESMKRLVELWNVIIEEFETPSILPNALNGCKLAVKDGHTFEIMVESQTCYDNLNADSGNGNGKTNIEELKAHISDMSGGIEVPVELTKIEKGELGGIKGLNELVTMPIIPDERKDEV